VARYLEREVNDAYHLYHKVEPAHLSKYGNNSKEPGVSLQSLMRSHTTAKDERTCTPAALILSFASLEIRSLKAPDASALA